MSIVQKVIKRDGRQVPFDLDRISAAVEKALLACNYAEQDVARLAQQVAQEVLVDAEHWADDARTDSISVETIQDLVEEELMTVAPAAAKQFILYRDQRTRNRELKSVEHKVVDELVNVSPEDNDDARENANVNSGTTMGALLKVGEATLQQYALRSLYRPEHVKLFEDGVVHLHDIALGCLTINCINIPLGQLLRHGYSTGHGFLRPPTTIGSAATLACVALQSSQNDFLGGQAISTFDYDLARYVARSYIRNMARTLQETVVLGAGRSIKTDEDLERLDAQIKKHFIQVLDEWIDIHSDRILTDEGEEAIVATLQDAADRININFHPLPVRIDYQKLREVALHRTERDTYQAMEGLVHNLCSLAARGGGQVPFSSINFGTDTSEEGRMVIRNILKAIDAGLGAGETAIFPIAIFKLKDGINTDPQDPNYDLFELSCKVSARRSFPNYISLDAPFNLKYYKEGHPETEVSSMGCLPYGAVVRLLRADILRRANEMPLAATDPITGEYQPTVSHFVEREGELRRLGAFVSDSKRKEEVARGEWLVYDSLSPGWVKITNVIENPPTDKWVRIVFHSGITMLFTEDHYLPRVVQKNGLVVKKKGATVYERVNVKDLHVFDRIPRSWAMPPVACVGEDLIVRSPDTVEQDTFVISDIRHITLEKPMTSYCLETESDRFDVNGICSHNCRTRTISNVYDPTKEQVTGRGNLYFNTINLPYLALQAKEELGEGATFGQICARFMELLEQTMEACVEICRDRFEIVARRHVYNYPFSFGQYEYAGSEKLKPDDEIREAIKNGTQTIGFIGLAETLVALCGKHHGESAKAQDLGLKIVGFMNDWIAELASRTKINYSLMGTPAEGCSGKLLRKTRKRFGTVPGVTDKEYFTNSHHIPVTYKISAYDKVDIEAPYHALEPGGAISYVECKGSIVNNPEAFKDLVLYMKNASMGYFSINHPLDRCPVCGSVLAEIGDTCPVCGRHEGEGVPLKDLLKISGYKLRADQIRDLHLTKEEEEQLLREIASTRQTQMSANEN